MGENGCDRSNGLVRVGSLIRELRLERGLSMSGLARRCAVAPSTISRLERGELRPRRSLLMAIGWGLDPDRRGELREMLLAAAGDCLAADTPGWEGYRFRRQVIGMNKGTVPLPVDTARRVAAHVRSGDARRRAFAILDRPGALDDPAALAAAADLMEVAVRSSTEGGRAIRIGDVVYGL